MLSVGDAFEEAVGGAKDGEADVRAADERGEAFAMAFAGFAEEDGFDAARGAESFFDEAGTFDTDGAVIGGKTAAESDAELLEPAIIAAGEEVGGGGGIGGGGHGRKGSKCWGGNAIGVEGWQRSDISDQEEGKRLRINAEVTESTEFAEKRAKVEQWKRDACVLEFWTASPLKG